VRRRSMIEQLEAEFDRLLPPAGRGHRLAPGAER
jgi:hypothetical protein